MMTAKEYVLQHYPTAVCEKITGSLYYIYTSMTGEKIIGSAKSEGNAWVNAKKKILGKTKRLTTAIEWVLNSDGTPGYAINLWIGCSKISPACDNCYAEISRVSTCLNVKWGDHQPRYKCNPYKKLTAINKKAQVAIDSWERQKIEWNLTDAELIEKGFIKPPRIRVFINPNSDIFDNKAPQEWRDEFFNFVWSTPSIDYILVTKRIGKAKDMIPQSWLKNGYPANVWQLITVCNQEEAQRDISKLLMLKIKVRGLSIEPMLSEIDLFNTDAFHYDYSEDSIFAKGIFSLIDWVIVGGESGKNARPMHPNWARKIRDQCVDAYVPFFFKQGGELIHANQIGYQELDKLPAKLIMRCGETGDIFYKIGKKRAGNLLDGQVWQQMPEMIK